MVRIDEKNREIVVTIQGDEETLEWTKLALIDLLKNFRKEDSGAPEETFQSTLDLLEELTAMAGKESNITYEKQQEHAISK